jgi:CRISPR-associated protein Cas5d
MNDYPSLEVKVWGDFACFTRPEMKAERVSYPVMTPSGARGLLEAIFWKPEIFWKVREIRVLKDIRYFSLVRNEVNKKANVSTAQGWAIKGDGFYYAEDDRAQRHTLALRDVCYIIKADIALKEGVREDPAKYRDQFRRRVDKGQCFHRPYLGCREFAADFSNPTGDEKPLDLSMGLGLMLFDLDFEKNKSGRGKPRFFQAELQSGVLNVPPELYA